MSDNEQDLQLVRCVQRGDKQLFNLLVIKYQHKVMGLVMRFIHDSSEAQDVAQEAFIKAYRALGNFRGESAFYTWLYRIAVNTAKNFLISRSRRPPEGDIDFNEAELLESNLDLRDLGSPEHILLRNEMRSTIRHALDVLPQDLRTAFMLRESDGLSYEDIAQIMSCPVGTIRSRIFRAREAVDKALQPLLLEA